MGLGPRVRDWAVGLAEVKRRTTAGGGALLTRQTGLLLSAEVKRRTTAGGGVLLTRWFAFSAQGGRRPRSMTCGSGPPCQGWAVVFGEDEEACYRGSVACTLRGGLPPSHSQTNAQVV
jgi:hypothetical protein